MNDVKAIAIIGPTAIGKTALSFEVADRYSCEIISVDSMQVYRYMDIGTAKASVEERQQVPHHLIDIVDPDEEYSAAQFAKDAAQACRGIMERGKMPLFVGGSGLYLRGIIQGLFEIEKIDPDIRKHLKEMVAAGEREELFSELEKVDPLCAQRIHRNDTHRLLRALEIYHSTGRPWSELLAEQRSKKPFLANMLLIGLTTTDRTKLYETINKRVDVMIDQGLLAEAQKLLAMGYHGDLKSMQSIGYRHMVNFIRGMWSWDESVGLLARDTRRYAKRQYTWFGKNKDITWFDVFGALSPILSLIDNYLK